MDVLLKVACLEDLAWIESAVRSCPTSMAEFGGFYGHASDRLPPLLGDDREVLIIWNGERRLGFVDVDEDPSEPGALNLTYFVTPQERRRGVGRAALELVARRYPTSSLVVAIAPSNVASLQVARRAGFVEGGLNRWDEICLRRRDGRSDPD